MRPTIDLIRTGAPSPGDQRDQRDQWDRGRSTRVAPTSGEIGRALAESSARGADAALVLDGVLELPPTPLLDGLLAGSGDIWHAGLHLGNGGQPRALDHVAPVWMLNLDPDPGIEATSWRLSLRCCLLRTRVVDHLGSPADGFDTLAGAALDLGLHAIRSGAAVRHVPELSTNPVPPDEAPTPADGLRIIARHHGRRWLWWAGWRRARHTHRLAETVREVAQVGHEAGLLVHPRPFPPTACGSTAPDPDPGPDHRVSVLVPTVDRYPYLRTLLEQLAEQTVPPAEVLVVDQTPVSRRADDIDAWVPGLPVRVLTLETAGQCSSRNAGILASSGELILFLDDDDEIGPDLIESHLRVLAAEDIAASSGGVDDVGAPPPPYAFTYPRVSDVFPTNNTMLRRQELAGSGLFDLAFDRGARADHDLGTRLYLNGALLRFDPDIRLVHHHAPRGGLRTHGARTVTRASSRHSVTERHLPEVTQLYLWHRYYTPEQVAEARIISIVSLLGHDGTLWQRAVRACVQLALLPDSIRQVRLRDRRARAMAHDGAAIPELPSGRRSAP